MMLSSMIYSKKLFRDIFIVITFSMVHLVINGYYFKSEPALLFTLVKAFTYKSMYPGDIIRLHGIRSFLIPILSVFAKTGCVECVVFGLYIVCLIAFYAISMKLTSIVSNKKETPYLFALFLLCSRPVLGGVETFAPYFSYSTVAIPLALLSLYFIFKEKYIFCALLMGLIFNLHPISAIAIYLFYFFLLVFNEFERRKEAVFAFVLAIIVSVPLILWKLSDSSMSSMGIVDPIWFDSFKIRSAHHFFPFASRYNFNELVLLALSILMVMNFMPKNRFQKKAYLICIYSMFLCVINYSVIHLWPVAFVMQMQLYRTAFFILFFAGIFFVDQIIEVFTAKNLLMKIGTVLAFVLLVTNKILLCLIVLGSLLLMQLILRRNLNKKVIFALVVITSLIVLRWKILDRSFWNWKMKHFAIEIDFPWLDSWDKGFNSEWVDIQEWSRKNTPTNSIFIIPPYIRSFRYRGQRTIVGNWKDGTLGIYDPVFEKIWRQRMKDLKCEDLTEEFGDSMPPRDCVRLFRMLKEEDFLNLAKKYKANFLVLEKGMFLELNEIYANEDFHIYKF